MLFKILTVTALACLSSAQTLLEVLSSQNASLSTLNTLLSTQPALISALGSASNITVLAPNNQAISTFLNSSAGTAAAANPGAVAALLTYHVLNGTYFASDFDDTSDFIPTLLTNTTYENVTGGQVLDLVLSGQNSTIYSGLKANSSVVTPNLNFTGGVIHIIDNVLTLPTPPSNTTLDLGLTALVGALTQANLLSTVDSLSDITIFAPSNAAFQAISSATSNLTTEQLTSILTYHVINGTVAYSSDLSDETITTLGGQSLRIEVEDGNVFVNSAKVVIADVLVANGVVHVIDNVLNPANTTASAPTGTATGSGSPAFSGASSASDIPFTSGVTATTTAAISTVTSTASGTGAGTGTSSSSTGGASMPTGAIGAAALFGAAGLFAANV